MSVGRTYRIQTPAKINFFLNIQSKRADGYHNLLMDLVPVSLFDQIQFQVLEKGGVELFCNRGLGALEDNLVMKAVRLLEKKAGQCFSLRISLAKAIPHGAGLGGGSSDAAATLVFLNHLYRLGFSTEELAEQAAGLGADVPFFLDPRPALASGIGTSLKPLEYFPELFLTLLYPGFGISTADAYRNCRVSGFKTAPWPYQKEYFGTLQPTANDFWLGLSSQYPKLEKARQDLLNAGAMAAGMSGSGSCLYGIYANRQQRDLGIAELKKRSQWQLFPCQTLVNYSVLNTFEHVL